MPTERPQAATLEELKRELAAVRQHGESIQAALYDLQLSPPEPVSGKEASYRQLVRRIRETVRAALPREAIVLVLSKGDQLILDLYGRRAWHFPQTADGRYGGYYPKRGLSAVAHLEAVRARGGEYLLLPATSLWWLDHYPEFRRHLERRYLRVVAEPDTCVIYSLTERPAAAGRPLAELEQLLDEETSGSGRELAVLDWGSALPLESELRGQKVFSPPADGDELPYLDDTIDVIVTTDDADRLAEARRVASVAVVSVASPAPPVNGRPPVRVSIERRPSSGAASPGLLPSVSIVIPCHDGAELTRACLTSLLETLPKSFEGEIIVVDDASSDGTRELVRALRRSDRRIRSLRNRRNVGFLGSCNSGAAKAAGDFLLFLNNDTVLLPGWLPPLLRTFRDFPDAGAAGGRLLNADGTLQEAGGIVFDDGSAAKFGYGDPDADAPLYRYVREVDYVSGALLATPRDLFDELGGFDARYGFGFYDDDDYCFALREAGRRVYYQPESAIVHVEGGSVGTDLSSGLKRNQVRNRLLFAEKWESALASQPRRPEPLDRTAHRLLAARGCLHEAVGT
jgi:GT2 family glycosyltransferase